MRPDLRPGPVPPVRHVLALLLAAASLSFLPRPAGATFHLNEITRVMAAFNGDSTIQAVEMKSLSAGQNLVVNDSINVYDANGAFVASLGKFAADVANSATGAHILCATAAFQTRFGITADLTLSPGIPAGTGQVAFKNVGCLVDAVAYGNVVTPKAGTTSAPALPSGLAYVLVRTVDDATLSACPLAENSAADFALESASTGAPVTFTNNAGTTVSVASTMTAVAEGSEAAPRFRVGPNPAPGRLDIRVPGGGLVRVFDARGTLVRSWQVPGPCCASAETSLAWDGADRAGHPVPSGIYFVQYRAPGLRAIRRVALLR